jgi:hypothetical protein
MLAELADEGALVTESASQSDFSQTVVRFSQGPAGSQNARPHQESVGSDPEGGLEPPLNLPG